ncbi:thioesterase family protein [Streptomyces sp. NPDC048057]|uniref:acyl-CoA thioesterase n=1 Tax=Streptomyces sp. NPDC048057 TaxID=3155628 RepID=UPI0033E44E79
MDMNRHINNALHSTFLEEARLSMFADLVPEDPRVRLVNNFVVAEQSMKFTRQLVYRPEPISVVLSVSEVRAAAFTLECEIRDEQHAYLTAKTLIVAFDLAMNSVRRLTDSELRSLSQYQL